MIRPNTPSAIALRSLFIGLLGYALSGSAHAQANDPDATGDVPLAPGGASPLNTTPKGPAREEDHPAALSLWPAGAPGSESRKNEPETVAWRGESGTDFPITYNIHNPSISPYLPPKDRATGAAIIVAPGGAHQFLISGREGYEVCDWLAQHGVASFMLKYRLAKDKAAKSHYRVDVEALADAQRAVRVVRAHATDWGIDPTRIGILGFASGGDLALRAGTHYDTGVPGSPDPVERIGCRPDFMVLMYPSLPSDGTIDGGTPRAFLACAADDHPGISQGIANIYLQLRQAGVSAELHVYARGGHGFGIRNRALPVSAWPTRLVEWMGESGLLRLSPSQ